MVDIIEERDGWADGIYLNLKKAFDKVPYKRLWKLEKMGGHSRRGVEMDGRFPGS